MCQFNFFFGIKVSLVSFDSNMGVDNIVKKYNNIDNNIVKMWPKSKPLKIRSSCLLSARQMKNMHQAERRFVQLQLIKIWLDFLLEGGFYSCSQSHQSWGAPQVTVWHLENVFLFFWRSRFNNIWKINEQVWQKRSTQSHSDWDPWQLLELSWVWVNRRCVCVCEGGG